MRRRHETQLSVPEFRALAFIWRHEGTDLSGLAEHLGLSLPSASKIVSALINQDLVSRRAGRSDRRYVVLGVTPAGRRTIIKTRQATTRVLEDRLASLDPAQQARMARALHELGSYFNGDHARAGAHAT